MATVILTGAMRSRTACPPEDLAEAIRATGHVAIVAPLPGPGPLAGVRAFVQGCRAHAAHRRTVLCEEGAAGLGAWLARWIVGGSYFLLITETSVGRYRRWPIWPWVLRSVFKRAGGVVVFNTSAREQLIRFGVRRQHVTLCGPPTTLRPEIPEAPRTPMVFARVSPTSPHTTQALLRVLGHLLEQVPQTTLWVIAPEGDSALEARVEAMGLTANVRVVDALPSQPAGVALAYAARGEAPCVRLAAEAMGHGLTLVAARHGLLSDWMRDDEHALLVSPGDEVAAADALARVIRKPALANALATAAHARAAERHTWGALMEILTPARKGTRA